MLMLTSPAASWALRPFDSTDADVVGPHEVELELGPLGYLDQGGQRFPSGPSMVLNYGIAARAEVVAQAELRHAFSSQTGEASTQLVDTGLLVKQVLREGSLQGADGLSLATEYGILLPEVRGDRGLGVSLAGIASEQWGFGTLHVNAVIQSTRTHHLDLFGGAIFEGPAHWTVRPVAEVFIEREYSVARTVSGLLGAIWPRSDRLSFDIGLRLARSASQTVREVRAGLTWSFVS